MSIRYQAVNWNRQKRIYDLTAGAAIILSVGGYTAISLARPYATLETALIRAFGVTAFVLLHLILIIGPLARLDRHFLPLLYNRRHLGVAMALLATAHAVFATVQYHGGGNVPPVVSLLQGAPATRFPAEFPFEYFGLAALIVLAVMAATSHDFWLSVLTPPVWKAMHMTVYLAYGALLLHVALGRLQPVPDPAGVAGLLTGALLVFGLHAAAGVREWRRDAAIRPADRWVDVCALALIPEGRAVGAVVGGERVAIFRHGGRLSCVSGVCRHQNGPLAEGRMVDGCITCPWHGYQYRPEDGRSPPPFTDVIPTYRLRIHRGRVLVHPEPNPAGTRVEPVGVEDMEQARAKDP